MKVYWIRYDHHTDPYNEGYIGISIDHLKRFKYHTKGTNCDNSILYKAIQKGARLEVLHEVDTREDALNLELLYRPKDHIGWNIIAGGVCPPKQWGNNYSGFKGKTHTEDTKNEMSAYRKKLKWFNNGVNNVRSLDCPDGYQPGRVVKYNYNLSEEGKKNLGRKGKRIQTPFGTFDTIASASIELKMTPDQISWKIKKSDPTNWYIIKDS